MAQGFDGRGLAKLCAAYAILGWSGTGTGVAFVSVHLRTGTAACVTVAAQLGLVRTPHGDFSAPLRSDLTAFDMYQGEYREVARAALGFLVQRGAFDECMRERMRQGW